MKKGIIGKKIGMTQIFDEAGKVIPVTVIEAGPCVVVQKKTAENDGYEAVQLGFGEVKVARVNKPMKGHFDKADVACKKELKEFRLDDCSAVNVGDVLKADTFGGNYDQQTYPYQEPYQPVSQGFGIASMVLGILALILFCSCVNIILAVIAIIFGIIQLATPGSKKGMAIAGLITSALSILLFLIFSVVFAVSADFQNGFEQGVQNGLRGDLPNQHHYESDLPDYYDDEYDYYDDFYDDFYDDDDTF